MVETKHVSVSERKFQRTNAAAREAIASEAERREWKTARLRKLRLAKEAEEPSSVSASARTKAPRANRPSPR